MLLDSAYLKPRQVLRYGKTHSHDLQDGHRIQPDSDRTYRQLPKLNKKDALPVAQVEKF